MQRALRDRHAHGHPPIRPQQKSLAKQPNGPRPFARRSACQHFTCRASAWQPSSPPDPRDHVRMEIPCPADGLRPHHRVGPRPPSRGRLPARGRRRHRTARRLRSRPAPGIAGESDSRGSAGDVAGIGSGFPSNLANATAPALRTASTNMGEGVRPALSHPAFSSLQDLLKSARQPASTSRTSD